MDGIYGWIRNLTGFFLFMSVIENLLPNKKYGRYVRLFSGMILILLVLQPLTGSLRLEDKIAHYYESFVFQYQADDLQSEILGIEKQRLAQMIAQYEHAVEQDVGQMAADMGFAVRECSVTINGEEGTEQFGTVTGIKLKISAGQPDSMGEAGPAGEDGLVRPGTYWQSQDSQPPQPIEPVTIEAIGGSGQGEAAREHQEETGNQGEASGKLLAEALDQPEEAVDVYSRNRGGMDLEIGKLRRKISSYYSLEEAYVEIQIVEGQG